QGSRTTTHSYFSSGSTAGFLASITDALGDTTAFSRDFAGRPLSETRADATTLFEWDANGNLSAVTPPGKPEHAMTHTPVNLLSSYDPPAAGLPNPSTSYVYSPDRE